MYIYVSVHFTSSDIYDVFYVFSAGITKVIEDVQALQQLDQSVEMLIRLVCTVPGWNEKNVQVLDINTT